ncbi:MAG: 1-deoxy-D-xylulose-5-phosphate synthase [Acidimicrobiales bacterium]|nr:1-deoxy-D-xylulose-5-phosphate synthase [Acidimicrobiales bacterium]MDG2218041.1 1-deoxy-D-xylulose-5-phosphate synthase [Acidimicrobiales bacterium]
MLLETLTGPQDLLGRSYAELDDLAEQIRHLVIESVNEHGGHLGSNLGAVELTIALHRVFRSPHDPILWDTGHQAYVHKILTGRAANFAELREGGGLSGYPSRSESEHDWIENSHASTVLSYAHGLATAFNANDERRRVVAVIGDGALTGGMAFEGLNNLGHSGSEVVIVLNDNGRSYAPTVSRLSESLIKIRNNPVYMRRQAKVEEIAERIPWVGEQIGRGLKMSKAAVREMWEPPAFFENLGIRYTGPFDGHDVESIEEALHNAAEFEGPTLVHVLTQKGRGYAPAEQDDVKNMHDTGSMKEGSYTAAFSETLVKLGDQHPELVAITAAMPDSTGLLPFRERFPDRCIDVGIAEQHAVTAATGMAMGGLRPLVVLYATFLTRAFDQVNLDVGLHGQPVIFCLDRAGITGPDGASHHGILDLVLLTKVPGMTVFAPSSYQEVQQMMEDAMDLSDGPVAIRWSRGKAAHVGHDEIGSGLNARKVTTGDGRVALVGFGQMLPAAVGAAELLAADGIDVTIYDPRVVQPLDPSMVDDLATHDVVVSIEDGLRVGGAGAGVRDALGERDADCRVRVLGVPVEYVPHGHPDDLHAGFGLNAAGIASSVRELL